MPVFIMAYNQLTYISNIVRQLEKYTNDIVIIDNNSCFQPLLNYYSSEYKYTLLKQNENYGNRVFLRPNIQQLSGNAYILTDPDLEFNSKLPSTWISDLVCLSNVYNAERVGFALDISGSDIRTDIMFNNQSIVEWEQQFWKDKISDPDYELYKAPIDTTLCLIQKNKSSNFHIRVAGNFTCRHIPWHINYKKHLLHGENEHYLKENKITNWF